MPIFRKKVAWCCQEQLYLTSTDFKLFKCHFLQFFEVVEDYLSMQNTSSRYVKNLISLNINITNMDDY